MSLDMGSVLNFASARRSSLKGDRTPSVKLMTDRRRVRGTIRQPVRAQWKIEAHTKDFIDTMAHNAGISSSYMIELMAKHIQLDERGVPEWFTTPENVRERPIDAA